MKTMVLKMIFVIFFFSGLNFYALSVNAAEKKGEIKVEVVDGDDGLPLAGVQLTLYKWNGSQWVKDKELASDNQGFAKFTGLQVGGKYLVKASMEGYDAQSREFEKIEESETAIFALHAEASTVSMFLRECSRFFYFLKKE